MDAFVLLTSSVDHIDRFQEAVFPIDGKDVKVRVPTHVLVDDERTRLLQG